MESNEYLCLANLNIKEVIELQNILNLIPENKTYKCKGLHQYEHKIIEEKEGLKVMKWVCQCGKYI